MALRIAFEESRCTNCHLCTMFCSLAFGAKGVHQIRPAIARIRVAASEDGTRYAAHVCMQCETPVCAEACPVSAIARDAADGPVLIDEEVCVGCENCVEACPFQAVFMADGKAVKCEVCDDPLCVRACAEKALTLVETDAAALAEQEALYREVRL